VEVGVNIKFEPSTLNESRAMLFISSPEAGEYSCILIGQSSAPQPKGPFKIAGPKPPAIDFKNPFFEACEFIIRVDNPSFAVSAKSPMKIDVMNFSFKSIF
jgi:hydrocephalus-inducing protein